MIWILFKSIRALIFVLNLNLIEYDGNCIQYTVSLYIKQLNDFQCDLSNPTRVRLNIICDFNGA